MLYKTRKNYHTQDQTKTFKGCCVAVSREDMHSHFWAIQSPEHVQPQNHQDSGTPCMFSRPQCNWIQGACRAGALGTGAALKCGVFTTSCQISAFSCSTSWYKDINFDSAKYRTSGFLFWLDWIEEAFGLRFTHVDLRIVVKYDRRSNLFWLFNVCGYVSTHWHCY